jgi:hypothetical protein
MDGPSKILLMETFVAFFKFFLHNEYNYYFYFVGNICIERSVQQ